MKIRTLVALNVALALAAGAVAYGVGTALNPTIPDGKYIAATPNPELAIVIRGGKIVAHDYGLTPDEIKDQLKVVDYNKNAKAIEVIDYGLDGGPKVITYCAADTFPTDKIPTNRRVVEEMTMKWVCDKRHGPVYVPRDY